MYWKEQKIKIPRYPFCFGLIISNVFFKSAWIFWKEEQKKKEKVPLFPLVSLCTLWCFVLVFLRNKVYTCKNSSSFEIKKSPKKVNWVSLASSRSIFIIEGFRAKRAYISFWANFHVFQDWADYWQTDLLGHDKHRSVQVCLPKISSILQEMKIGPKSDIHPLLHENLQL